MEYFRAFPQSKFNKDDHVYMHLPAGFDVDGDRSNIALKLKKKLYGLKQESFNWSKMLNSGLLELCYTPSKVDPCLYYK